MAKTPVPGHDRSRHRTRAFTAGAAASLVLGVAPIAPATGVAVDVRPRTVARAGWRQNAHTARHRFVAAVRRAERTYRAAQRNANEAFVADVTPITRRYTREIADSSSRAHRCELTSAMKSQTARYRLRWESQLDLAYVQFVERRESARVAYLVESNANPVVLAGSQYRRAVNVAAAEYQTSVRAARCDYRINVGPAVAAFHAQKLTVADRSMREAFAARVDHLRTESAGVLQLRLRQARDSFQAKIALARRSLQACAA